MSKNIENRRAFFEGLGQTSATVSFLTVGEKKRVADVAPAKMPTDCGATCMGSSVMSSPTNCGSTCVGSSVMFSAVNCGPSCYAECGNSCISNNYHVPYASTSQKAVSTSASLASSTARISAKTIA